MQIVIHAGGIPFNGDTINERSLGGSESAAYYTAKELVARGHRVVVFTEHQEGGNFDGVEYVWMGDRHEAKPMGENWHWYCEHTPHDVNIVQRQPGGLMFHIQSKINLWWAHDIALKRNNPHFMAQLWQTDAVLPVSSWFKEQIQEAWLCNPDIIKPIHNGVDYSLFEQFELKDNSRERKEDEQITLLYSSRPERGLANLVGEGGIMEKLSKCAPHIKLIVCGYEHPVPQLDGFYNYLRQRCEELSNVEHRGQLTKEELARVQCQEADVWCYPTEFEEVSCITAMECMAAGMYLLTTNTAALPETIGDTYDNQTRFNYGEDIVEKYVRWLSTFDNQFRRRPYRGYTWDRVADEFEEIISQCFGAYADKDAIARHYLHNSDIVAFKDLLSKDGQVTQDTAVVSGEVYGLYDPWMYDQKKYAEHYADGTEEMYDGPTFTYEGPDFINHPRFQQVAAYIKKHEPKHVVDYGCAHGMFTNYLAQMFPDVTFTGIDVSPAAIKVAKEKAHEMGVDVTYQLEDWLNKTSESVYHAELIILGEILEHVPDPIAFMDIVKQTIPDAHVIITTPFGPWESLSYEKDYPKRFHLHHFERSDLSDLFGHQEEIKIDCLPTTHTAIGELLGWYITTFKFTAERDAARPIDYERKFRETVPFRQTVSLCMIVKDAEATLLKTLRSVEPYVDEIVIGIDTNTSDNTRRVLTDFQQECLLKHRSPQLNIEWFMIPSPLEIGFDAARNLTLEKATKHWIMWCDSDEEFISGERLPKYLRNNGWHGYGIPQHHFSTEPTGVLSTDYPVRIFRRNNDVRFRGVVHEHPENINKPDDGVGFAYVLFELHFSHSGYGTEVIRRKRFERNIGLMARDREQNPDRLLGKFLWIRDLALMCRFELEQTQGAVTQMMHQRAVDGLKLWEETIDKCSDHPQVRRMIKDHLEFYDTLVKVLGEGFTFSMNVASAPGTADIRLNGTGELKAQFLNRRHLDKFLSVVIDEEVKDYGTKYH